MLQFALFFVTVLRTAPFSVVLEGIGGQWITRVGHLLTN